MWYLKHKKKLEWQRVTDAANHVGYEFCLLKEMIKKTNKQTKKNNKKPMGLLFKRKGQNNIRAHKDNVFYHSIMAPILRVTAAG